MRGHRGLLCHELQSAAISNGAICWTTCGSIVVDLQIIFHVRFDTEICDYEAKDEF